VPAQLKKTPPVGGSVQTDADLIDTDIAAELISSGVTTQPLGTVIAVLKADRDGASINAAAKASGINHRTAQRILRGAGDRRRHELEAVG
jgi:hypothetical protein